MLVVVVSLSVLMANPVSERSGTSYVCPGFWRLMSRDGCEVRSDEFFDRRFIKITYGDDSHQVRTIPVFIKLLKSFRLAGLDDLRRTDGKSDWHNENL